MSAEVGEPAANAPTQAAEPSVLDTLEQRLADLEARLHGLSESESSPSVDPKEVLDNLSSEMQLIKQLSVSRYF